jgi:hypothetical protein
MTETEIEAAGVAGDASVQLGGPVDAEQQQAIWDAEVTEVETRIAKLEAKAEAVETALADARAEAEQLRERNV